MNIITKKVLDLLPSIKGKTYHDFYEVGEWFIEGNDVVEEIACLSIYGVNKISFFYDILVSGDPMYSGEFIIESEEELINFLKLFE